MKTKYKNMTGIEMKEVCDRIDNEGFHYCFLDYSDFEEIKDKTFHKLRLQYRRAAKEFAEYIGYGDGYAD